VAVAGAAGAAVVGAAVVGAGDGLMAATGVRRFGVAVTWGWVLAPPQAAAIMSMIDRETHTWARVVITGFAPLLQFSHSQDAHRARRVPDRA
jgi:hypothetical protein